MKKEIRELAMEFMAVASGTETMDAGSIADFLGWLETKDKD